MTTADEPKPAKAVARTVAEFLAAGGAVQVLPPVGSPELLARAEQRRRERAVQAASAPAPRGEAWRQEEGAEIDRHLRRKRGRGKAKEPAPGAGEQEEPW